jgi:8-oxo-dGTP diphosphatase
VVASRTVLAAGAAVWRSGKGEMELLVVHRPRHGDWSLPKGKLDPGERLPVTAVREVLEETSVPIRLGLPLSTVEYDVKNPKPMTKRVSYWVGRPIGSGDLAHVPDNEIDSVRWVGVSEIDEVLTYDRDRELVDQLLELRKKSWHKTRSVVVLRHAHALPRAKWTGDDQLRPLSEQGLREAHELVPLLAAYGVSQVVTSPSTRCVQTVEPYVEHLGAEMVVDEGLSEEEADPRKVAKRLRILSVDERPTVLCTHRPVLPLVLAALGLQPEPLELAQIVVVHRRRGRSVGTETHVP